MLMPLPATLRRLVQDYETLLAEDPLDGGGVPGARLRDLEYTLCVSTGTRDIAAALEAARSYLAPVAVADPSGPSVTPSRGRGSAGTRLSGTAPVG